jgi:hypothetical protein
MFESVDEWPGYYAGPPEHLHALGVIALSYAAFDDGMGRLYAHHPMIKGIPHDLADHYYFRQSQNRRLSAIRSIFKQYEKEQRVIDQVTSTISYFEWCAATRNTLLHSEQYPAMFDSEKDKLHLSKKDQHSRTGYLSLDINSLREIADKIIHGRKSLAATILYLRFRDTPAAQLPLSLRINGDEPLPAPLVTPPSLKLADHPETVPKHLRKSR